MSVSTKCLRDVFVRYEYFKAIFCTLWMNRWLFKLRWMLLWISKCGFFYYEFLKTIFVGNDETNNKFWYSIFKELFIAILFKFFNVKVNIKNCYINQIKLQNKITFMQHKLIIKILFLGFYLSVSKTRHLKVNFYNNII